MEASQYKCGFSQMSSFLRSFHLYQGIVSFALAAPFRKYRSWKSALLSHHPSFHLLYFTGIFHRKSDALCCLSHNRPQEVFLSWCTSCQRSVLFDDMWFFYQKSIHPQCFSTLICNFQFCSLNLLSVCQGCFGKLSTVCRLIFKSKHIRQCFLICPTIFKVNSCTWSVVANPVPEKFLSHSRYSQWQICRKGQFFLPYP